MIKRDTFMKRLGIPSTLLVVGLLSGLWLWLADRESAAQSPDSWRQLSLQDFVTTMESLTAGDEPVSDELLSEIRSQSAERLLSAVENDTPANYEDLVSLYKWGRHALSADQAKAVQASLNPTSDQVGSWTFDKMLDVQMKINHVGLPISSNHELTLAWLEGQDVHTLTNVDQLVWLFAQLQLMDRQGEGAQSISVQWTGTVQAPADGAYIFSVSPVDLNYRSGNDVREQMTKLWLGSEEILDSSQNGRTPQSQPVALDAGKAADIRIEFSFQCSQNGVISERPAIAMLYWEGPGISRRVVPSSALAPPAGNPEEHGLLGEYKITLTGAEDVTATRVDPAIDFVWYQAGLVVTAHEDLRAELAQQLYAVATSANTLAAWDSGEDNPPGDWQGNWAFLESLDTSRQAGWAETLIAHPALLADVDAQAAMTLYTRCRIGAPDAALRLLGTWAQLHAELTPELAVDFYQANRDVYRQLAQRMVWQYPSHFEQLEQDYLQQEGDCVLPIAYILSYGYWMQKEILDWIDKLETQLDDTQVGGDRRVNWLLARAQAAEIRHSRPGRHWWTVERALAGRGWLEEATLVAESEAVRLRAYKELAARQTVDERIDAARSILDQAATRCTNSESSAAIAGWRTELDAVEQAIEARHAQQEALAQQAYLDQLRGRYQRAEDRGDSAAAARYRDMLAEAEDTTD